MDRHLPKTPEPSKDNRKNTIEKLAPEKITPEYLHSLVMTPYKKTLHGTDGGPVLKIGDEHTTDEFNDPRIIPLLSRQDATVLIHDQGSLLMMSPSELSGAQGLSLIAPGVRQFLVTEEGITEYDLSNTNDDVRDLISDDVESIQAQGDEEAARKHFYEIIRENGWIQNEVKWEETEELGKLVEEMRDLLSRAKSESEIVNPSRKKKAKGIFAILKRALRTI